MTGVEGRQVAATGVPGGGWLDGARDFGVVEAIRAAVPPGADPVVYALTQFGDVWLLLVAVSLFVWYGSDRRAGVLAVAVALGGLGLVVGLKHLFALPRPPDPLPAYDADGFGFPSGHAVGATVVWGAMAWLSSWSTRQRRLAAASVVVILVGLSRVFLGVHYLGSVLAGFAAGFVFLAGALWVAKREPLRAFAVAAAMALFAIAAGAVADGATVLGGSAGGALAWRRVEVADERIHPAAALVGLGLFGGLWVTVEVVDPMPAMLFVANGVVVGGILGWPALVGSVRDRWGGRTGPTEEHSETVGKASK